MGKVYTTMQGKQLDMEKLALRNELTPAVGNARVNARGDELGPGGQIIRKREDILQDYYSMNPRAVKDEIGGRARVQADAQAAPAVEQTSVAPTPTVEQAPVAPSTPTKEV
jgi:hypothetical protein